MSSRCSDARRTAGTVGVLMLLVTPALAQHCGTHSAPDFAMQIFSQIESRPDSQNLSAIYQNVLSQEFKQQMSQQAFQDSTFRIVHQLGIQGVATERRILRAPFPI